MVDIAEEILRKRLCFERVTRRARCLSALVSDNRLIVIVRHSQMRRRKTPTEAALRGFATGRFVKMKWFNFCS